MFRIYFVNHFYFAAEEFTTLELALTYARSKGADVTIYRNDLMVASWGFLSGLRSWETPGQTLYEGTYGYLPRRHPMWAQLTADEQETWERRATTAEAL